MNRLKVVLLALMNHFKQIRFVLTFIKKKNTLLGLETFMFCKILHIVCANFLDESTLLLSKC